MTGWYSICWAGCWWRSISTTPSALPGKYNHSIFIVTLEGESLSPGGSMTGGAFRNSSNLLGRKRELTELEENVQKLEADIREARLRIEALREQRRARRTEAESLKRRAAAAVSEAEYGENEFRSGESKTG